MARGTSKDLVRAETTIQHSTIPTRYGRICLITDDYFAPRVFLAFEEQALFESIMTPREHTTGRLVIDLALLANHHALCFKLWQQNHTVI